MLDLPNRPVVCTGTKRFPNDPYNDKWKVLNMYNQRMIIDYGGGGDCLYWSLLALYDKSVAWSEQIGMRGRVRAFEQKYKMPVPIPHPSTDANRVNGMKAIRLIIAWFFEEHFDFYWHGTPDPKTGIPDRPYRGEIVTELQRLIDDGYQIDLSNETDVKDAYVHRILGYAPNGKGYLTGRDLYGTETEIDIAANVFGAKIFVFTKPQRGEFEDARVQQYFVPHLDKPTTTQQWSLYNHDDIHYQALMPWTPIPGAPSPPPLPPAAGGGGGGNSGKKRVRRPFVKQEEDNEDEQIRKAIALSLMPHDSGPGAGSSSTSSAASSLPNMSGLCLRR